METTTKERRRGLVRLFARRKTKPGATPGTIKIDPEAPPPKIHLIGYDATELEERDLEGPDEIAPFLASERITWINVDGLGHAGTIQAIGDVFSIHPLAVEDVVHVHQRPKVEEFEDQLFIVTRMVHTEPLSTEQVSIFLGPNFVLTFQENEGDCLDPVRDRIRKRKGRIHKVGADYLAYAILDAIVDANFPVLEEYGTLLEELETETIEEPARETLTKIHIMRRELMLLRRAIWPQREMVNRLLKDEEFIRNDTRIYLRDSYDHTVQLIDMLENYRDLASGLMDMYLSTISNRMNEVMKVLTIIATIFIPLSFVAGLYGMNFDTKHPWNMPELALPYGYPLAVGVMFLVGLGLVYYFWRKGWIGSRRG